MRIRQTAVGEHLRKEAASGETSDGRCWIRPAAWRVEHQTYHCAPAFVVFDQSERRTAHLPNSGVMCSVGTTLFTVPALRCFDWWDSFGIVLFAYSSADDRLMTMRWEPTRLHDVPFEVALVRFDSFEQRSRVSSLRRNTSEGGEENANQKLFLWLFCCCCLPCMESSNC